MSGLFTDIKATVKIVRIVGWREFNRLRKHLRDHPEEEAKEIGAFRVGNLRKEYNTACRALGSPDDWVYSETQLRRTRCNDPVLRYFAIDYLVRYGTDPDLMHWLTKERLEAAESRENSALLQIVSWM
jgi:hypothetical protein